MLLLVLAQPLRYPLGVKSARRFAGLVKDLHNRAALFLSGYRQPHWSMTGHDESVVPRPSERLALRSLQAHAPGGLVPRFGPRMSMGSGLGTGGKDRLHILRRVFGST